MESRVNLNGVDTRADRRFKPPQIYEKFALRAGVSYEKNYLDRRCHNHERLRMLGTKSPPG